MVRQGIFIGVAIGVFFAGLGIGYVAMQSSPFQQRNVWYYLIAIYISNVIIE